MEGIYMPKVEKLNMIAKLDEDVTVTVFYNSDRKAQVIGTLCAHPSRKGYFLLATATCTFELDGNAAYHINVNSPSFHINRRGVTTDLEDFLDGLA